MRLNRGTIVLVLALAVVLVAAVIIGGQQDSAVTTPTPTPDTASGALFTELPVNTVARVEVRDPLTGTFIELDRLDATNWGIVSTASGISPTPDNLVIESNIAQLVGLEYTARFESDQLADFGLTNPTYVLFIETGTGEAYTLYIGARTPTNPRYYAVVVPGIAEPTIAAEATGEATAEPTAEMTFEAVLPESFLEMTPEPVTRPGAFTLTGTQQIAVIPQTVVTTLTGWLFAPPFAAPTPTPAPTIPVPTPEATLEATAEATADAASDATPEVTPDLTPDVTPEATEAT